MRVSVDTSGKAAPPKRPDDDDESPPSTQRSPTYLEPELFNVPDVRSRNDRIWNTRRVDEFSGT